MTNLANKQFFVGIALANASTVDTGVAILDRKNHLSLLDKLYSMDDVKFFIDTIVGKQDCIFMVSLPHSSLMLNAKWKVVSKQYTQIHSSPLAINQEDWMDRFSSRGSEYFLKLKNENGLDIYRAELSELRKSFGLNSQFKARTPADCKFLQNTLKIKLGIKMPNNMLPAAQIEAVYLAYAAQIIASGKEHEDYKILFNYKGLDVISILEKQGAYFL